MRLGMLQSAATAAAADDDAFIKGTDDFLNESDSDEFGRSSDDGGDDDVDDGTFAAQFPTKKHHRFQDNEAIEVIKMTKIRHHNNNGHQAHYSSSNGHCPNAIATNDGYTIADKTRLYKMCEPVQKLPICR